MKLIYNVSRIKDERVHLGEYYQPRDSKVKSLAYVFYGWDVPSISGLPFAAVVKDKLMYTTEINLSEALGLEGQYLKFIIPIKRVESTIRKELKPYKNKLCTPKEDELGVSKIYSVQLHVEVDELAYLKIMLQDDYSWHHIQFDKVLSVKVIEASSPEFVIPVNPGTEVNVEALLQSVHNPKRKRRGKNRKDYRNREALEYNRSTLAELQEVKAEVQEIVRKPKSFIELEIERLEAEIASAVQDIESLTD
jgi:hypothetical protein